MVAVIQRVLKIFFTTIIFVLVIRQEGQGSRIVDARSNVSFLEFNQHLVSIDVVVDQDLEEKVGAFI